VVALIAQRRFVMSAVAANKHEQWKFLLAASHANIGFIVMTETAAKVDKPVYGTPVTVRRLALTKY
jgi:cytochrome b561